MDTSVHDDLDYGDEESELNRNIVMIDGEEVYVPDSDEDMDGDNGGGKAATDNPDTNSESRRSSVAGSSDFGGSGNNKRRYEAMDTGAVGNLNNSRLSQPEILTAKNEMSRSQLNLVIEQYQRDYEVTKHQMTLMEESILLFPDDISYKKQLIELKMRKMNLTREIDMCRLEFKRFRFSNRHEGMKPKRKKLTDLRDISMTARESGTETNSDINSNAESDKFVEPHSKNDDAQLGAIERLTNAILSAVESKQDKLGSDDQLQKSKIYRDLPTFSGAPEAWPNFISQFHEATATCKFSDSDNITRLQKALKDDALTAVKHYLIQGDNLPKVLETLERRFGRPDLIVESLIQKAREIRKVDERNLDDLVNLSCTIDNLTCTMENLQSTGHMTNPSLLREFLRKLPRSMVINWGKNVKGVPTPTIRDFADWLREEADAVSALNFRVLLDEKKQSRSEREVHFNATETRDPRKCEMCSDTGHGIWACDKFKELEIDAKYKVVTDKRLCFRCLGTGHIGPKCKRGRPCRINGCDEMHHRLLHKDKPGKRGDKPLTSLMQVEAPHTLMRILPVTLISESKTLETFAFLDGGGASTLIDAEAAKLLELQGDNDPLTLSWMSAIQKTQEDSKRVTLKIRGTKSDELFELADVRTVKNLKLPAQSLNYPKLVGRYPHLEGLPVVSYVGAKPLILIGQKHCHLEAPEAVIKGPLNTPIAYDTKLGWGISGPSDSADNRVNCCFVQINNDSDMYLHELIKKSFAIDDIGIKLTQKLESVEDQKALDLMKKYTRFDGERFEVPVLWRDEIPNLPANKGQALMRLYSIEKKMKANENYAEAYEAKVADYLKKGYASILPDNIELPKGKTWLLPTFGVYNPNKPGKLRFVMDAAAKHLGVSLNDALLKGPDLMCPLISVLLNFRRYEIAISGDIREMFHQVSIRPEDRSSQLFLWHEKKDYSKKITLQMNRMTFGSVSSPFCAQYAKNLNADRFVDDYPVATEIIKDHHYVDDCLTSLPNTESAIQAIKDVTYVHAQGGFEIVGWMSNNAEVVASVPEASRGIDIKTFDDDEQLTERTLGLKWSVKSDEFTFVCKFNRVDDKVMSRDYIPTKREMLKLVMSLYDPLGFIGHFTIKSRIILQDVWRSGTAWDEPIDSKLMPRWAKWIDLLESIKKIRIPRCFSSDIPKAKKLDLHVFADASSQAYGAVAYLLITTGNNEKKVAFLMSRARVAPLKPVTIPRMELQAALVATRLAETIRESLKLKINDIHYWSDSWTVLCWLRSEARKFQQFVSFRVGEILEKTEISQWHWVPTDLNPSDKLTREETPVDVKQESMWYSGPLFIRLDPTEWPKEPEVKPKMNVKTLEVRCEPIFAIIEEKKIIDFKRYSSYQKLLKVTGWVLRYLRRLRRQPLFLDDCENGNSLELNVHELTVAENLLIRLAQKESYPDELKALTKQKEIPTSSKILKFCPRITGGGIMSLTGRIDRRKFDEGICFPTILDGRHPLTKLIVKDEHERGFHIGQERLLNEIRQKFWITGLRKLIKTVVRTCTICKFIRATPKPQMMGNLPAGRQEMFSKPFTFCGLDYFGPIMTKAGKGRNPNKRYGALFTCLTTRAVHIEMAIDLTTDCCLLAIRRMMARRGQIEVLWTDEGRNFLGASRDLKFALENLDYDEMLHHLTAKRIDWRFNPPASPHMGGSWESLIRSVKNAIAAVTFDQKFTDETFRTFLAEVEWTLNSRPITFVSVNENDVEALTSNHILIGNSGGFTNWEDLNDERLTLRKRWLHSQKLANQFWKRWMKEYVPTLNIRSKWQTVRDNLKVDDLVLIADDNMPRNLWPKGKVLQVYPGQDGIVRVADIETNHGIFRRPITRICNLDLLDEPRSSSSGGGMDST